MDIYIYKVVTGPRGHEWILPRKFFMSREKALAAAQWGKEYFGQAALLTERKTLEGYELIKVEEY